MTKAKAKAKSKARKRVIDSKHMLVPYRDVVTGEVELIWNTRTGPVFEKVTSRAGNDAHVDRDAEAFIDPDHTPKVGDRVLVDMTPTRAHQLASERVREIEVATSDEDREVRRALHAKFNSIDEAIADAARWYMGWGTDVITVTSGFLEALQLERDAEAAGVVAAEHGPYEAVINRAVQRYTMNLARARGVDFENNEPFAAVVECRFRDRKGVEINFDAWRKLYGAAHDTCTLALDTIFDDGVIKIEACTGWSGVDPGDGLIFETIGAVTLLGINSGDEPNPVDRGAPLAYARDEAEAYSNHDRAVRGDKRPDMEKLRAAAARAREWVEAQRAKAS